MDPSRFSDLQKVWVLKKGEDEVKSDYRKVFHRERDRCSECGLFGCICQASLSEYGFEQRFVMKNASHNRRILGCPHKCLNANKECLNCFDFDKYQELVKL